MLTAMNLFSELLPVLAYLQISFTSKLVEFTTTQSSYCHRVANNSKVFVLIAYFIYLTFRADSNKSHFFTWRQSTTAPSAALTEQHLDT